MQKKILVLFFIALISISLCESKVVRRRQALLATSESTRLPNQVTTVLRKETQKLDNTRTTRTKPKPRF